MGHGEGNFLRLLALLGCFIITAGCPRQSGDAGTSRSRREKAAPAQGCKLVIRDRVVWTEVAKTEEELAQGLMFRTALHPDSGMLFVFADDEIRRFWMKNTYIPLAIAFIDKNGVITDILEMTPLDTESRYISSRPVRYALEVNAGWFTSAGIKPGDTVAGLPGSGDGEN